MIQNLITPLFIFFQTLSFINFIITYLKVLMKNCNINIDIRVNSLKGSIPRTTNRVNLMKKALDRQRLIHRMSELRYDEIKGPPSTQTDFVNLTPDLAVISAAIIITRLQLVLRPRPRLIRG